MTFEREPGRNPDSNVKFAPLAITGVTPSAPAMAAGKHIKVGVLTCAAGPKIGLLITSRQKISCSFQPDAHAGEHYSGTIREYGPDTDCAIGKRTTATILTQALNDRGVKAVMVGTGQTGLIQGARYGVALDAIPSQFCAGEMEAARAMAESG